MVLGPTDRRQRGVAASWVKGLAEVFKQEGLDGTALLREAGVDPAALDDPDARFPSETVGLLWQLAVARSGNPAIGLAVAQVPRPAPFDIVGYAMMSAPDLRGLLDRIARYFRVITDVANFTVSNDQDGCRARFDLVQGGAEVAWQRYAFFFGSPRVTVGEGAGTFST
jgi:Arabinose-binding domain of AraC transcription regulator, N-term